MFRVGWKFVRGGLPVDLGCVFWDRFETYLGFVWGLFAVSLCVIQVLDRKLV